VHSEAEEVRRLPPCCSSSSRCPSLTPSRPASQVSVYNDLEKRDLASESKLLRDEHEELEKQLYSVDWTKVRPFLLPSARPSRSGANAALPRTQVDSPEFAPKFEKAISMFIQHSDREEDEILRDLAAKLSPEDNDRLAKDFLAVRPSLSSSRSRLDEPCLTPRFSPVEQKRKVVPTRPHPAAPQSGGVLQKTLGMATKPHDKILEMLTGRSFADLKYEHGRTGVTPIKIDQSLLS